MVSAAVVLVCALAASAGARPIPAAQNPNATLVAKVPRIAYGGRAVLEAGYTIDVSAPVTFLPAVTSFVLEEQAFGGGGFAPSRAAQLRAINDSRLGRPSWTYRVAPAVTTAYRVRWEGFTSGVATVEVAPRLRLTRLPSGEFEARAAAARPLVGRRIELQRQVAADGWRTLRTLRLGPGSSTRFSLSLSRRSALRLRMAAGQAGPGYAEGFSRALVAKAARTG